MSQSTPFPLEYDDNQPPIPSMPAELRAEWVADLRSGDFHQGKNHLHTSQTNDDGTQRHEFCCLGVLCERAVTAGIVERVQVSLDGSFRVIYGYAPVEGEDAGKAYTHYPPPAVAEWAGLPHGDTNPYVRLNGGQSVIGEINDNGWTFEEISTMIEKQF